MTNTSPGPGSTAAGRLEATRPRPSAGTWAAAASAGLVAALLLRVRTSPDVDLWLHLRIGDLLRAGERFGPPPDPLAALADREYVPTQWLSQVGMSAVYDTWGMDGIQVTRLLLVLALGALVIVAARTVAPPTAAGLAAALTMFGAAAAWGERPQLAGLVILAGVLALWWRALDHRGVPWLVVPLVWLWANVHGGWVLGVALGALLTLGGLVDGRWARRPALLVLTLTPASVLAAALTPLGLSGVVEPFRVGEVAPLTANEWQHPAPLNPLFLAVVIACVVALIGVVRSRELRWTRLLTALVALALAVWMVRTIAVGAVLLAPALAAGLATLAARRDEPGDPPARRVEAGPWALAAALFLVVGGWHALSTPFGPPVSSEVSAAVDELDPATAFAVDGRAVGWVEWAHRDLRPLRDLRAEVYSVPVALAYEDFQEARPGWPDYADEQGVTAVLADRSRPLDAALEGEPGWRVAAEDADFRLWVIE